MLWLPARRHPVHCSSSAVTPGKFLDGDTQERLASILENSLRVGSEPGFFLWCQGALQALVPHEILVCGAANGPGRRMRMHRLTSTRYFQDEHFRQLCDSPDGLVPRLMGEWEEASQPILLFPEKDDHTRELLRRSELRNLVVHGMRGAEGEISGFYCFARTKLDDSERTRYIIEVVTPVVHSAFVRMLAAQACARGSAGSRLAAAGATLARSARDVTAREIEILQHIKSGKSTADIASTLRLSPFTVKNHVQKILRKLSAKSRSHAVAEAISRGLLPLALGCAGVMNAVAEVISRGVLGDWM
jgi:transcriptional regulator EpsA